MSSYIEAVVKAADALDVAEAALLKAQERLDMIKNHNGQRGYSVSVNGVVVDVSHCDPRTYQGTLIRGREMIHLGALKALGAELHSAQERVKLCRAALVAAASDSEV